MQITFTVPDDRAEFMLELLRNISFVSNPRRRRTRKMGGPKPGMDTTEYLLSSPANAESLRRSVEQLGRGMGAQEPAPAE